MVRQIFSFRKQLTSGRHRNVPLNILSVDKSGKSTIDRSALLEERSKTFTLDTSKPFKLNGGTAGVCEPQFLPVRAASHNVCTADRVLYTPERLSKIGVEAAQPDSCFSIEDRMGLVYDSLALSKAGLQKLSSALNLIDNLRNEKECKKFSVTCDRNGLTMSPVLILDAISGNLAGLVSTWWEYPEIVDNLNAFRRVKTTCIVVIRTHGAFVVHIRSPRRQTRV